jgi:membrane-bound lytic murein transglycosylase A
MKRTWLATAALLVLPLTACRSTGADYDRALPDGAPALLPLGKKEKPPDLTAQWNARDEILPALDRSIAWTRRKHAQQFFPIAGIDYARALASLERFREVLVGSASAESFNQTMLAEFEVLKSAGWDGRGGGVLFTGYCTPLLRGSLERTARYRFPLYALPDDLVKGTHGEILGQTTPAGLVPYPSRRVIEANNLLADRGLELVWLEDPVDAFIAHVNGSAFVELESGEIARFGYAGKNGREYRSLGKELIADGVISVKKMSLGAIRDWAKRTSEEQKLEYLHRNRSYVFFTPIVGNPHGSLDVEVATARSLATDKTLFPRGALVFVDAKVPNPSGKEQPFQQLLFDQDTGGAIRTAGRADIYLGIGPDAEARAGATQAEGQLYYFFLK